MLKVVTAALVVSLAAGMASARQQKGGKLPWYKGKPQAGLAKAKKEGKNAFLYFTSKG